MPVGMALPWPGHRRRHDRRHAALCRAAALPPGFRHQPRHGGRAAVAQPLDPALGQLRRGGDRRARRAACADGDGRRRLGRLDHALWPGRERRRPGRRPHPVGHLLRFAQSLHPGLCRQRPRQRGKARRREPGRDRHRAGRVAGRRRVDRPAGRAALGVPDLRRPDADLARCRAVAAAPAARDRRQEALPAAGPASPGDLGLHAGLHRRWRVPADALLPDEGFDHLGGAGAGDGDPSGAALAGRDHHRPAGRLDRRPLRRAAHLDRQRRAAGRGLRADRARSRACWARWSWS